MPTDKDDDAITREFNLSKAANYRRAEWCGMFATLFLLNTLCAIFVDAAAGWIVLWALCAAVLLTVAGVFVWRGRQWAI